MHPIAARESLRPDRKVMCRYYERCLDLAVANSWSGFTCGMCRDFQPLTCEPHQWAQDIRHCTALLVALLDAKGYACAQPKAIIDGIGWDAEDAWIMY